MSESKKETILDKAKDLLAKGKRCMALEDYQKATDYLEHSCELFEAYYGMAERECADAYLEYGFALVALAKLEAASGTNKLMKKEVIESEEEEDVEDDDDSGTQDNDDKVKENRHQEDPEASDGEGDEEEEGTTIDDAWLMLCLATRIYMDDESPEGRLKLTETLQKLGEISIEWDSDDNAVSLLEENI